MYLETPTTNTSLLVSDSFNTAAKQNYSRVDILHNPAESQPLKKEKNISNRSSFGNAVIPLISVFGGEINPIINSTEQAFNIRKQFSDKYGNIANFFADLIEVRGMDVIVQMNELINLKDNLMSTIVEHPLAKRGAIDNYKLEWDSTGEVRVGNKTMTQLLSEGIENTYGQIPDFEIKRNEANLRFLKKLQLAHRIGDSSEFVEISPSPDLTADAIERGYKGNDTIQIHKADGSVTQYWLNPQSAKVYSTLLERIGLIDRNTELKDQYKIMLTSGRISASQKNILMDFIYHNSIESSSKYTSAQTKEYFESEVMDLIDQYFSIVLSANFKYSPEVMKALIEEVYLKLGVIQESVEQYVSGNEIQSLLLKEMTINQAINHIDSNLGGYKSYSACGKGSNKLNLGAIYGNSTSIINNLVLNSVRMIGVKTEQKPHESEPCSKCGRTWPIKEGDSSTYEEICPNIKCEDEFGNRTRIRCD